jgi:hypothetical protein
MEVFEGEKLKYEYLEHLNLSFNKLGSLANAVIHEDFGLLNSNLKFLYFQECKLDRNFANFLGNKLDLIKNIRHLDLSFNQFDSMTGIIITKVV